MIVLRWPPTTRSMRQPLLGLLGRVLHRSALAQRRLSSDFLHVGDVAVPVRSGVGKDRIPRGYAKQPHNYTQNELRTLRWIAQKVGFVLQPQLPVS